VFHSSQRFGASSDQQQQRDESPKAFMMPIAEAHTAAGAAAQQSEDRLISGVRFT